MIAMIVLSAVGCQQVIAPTDTGPVRDAMNVDHSLDEVTIQRDVTDLSDSGANDSTSAVDAADGNDGASDGSVNDAFDAGCPPGLSACFADGGAQCVDLSSSNVNCGACGVTCDLRYKRCLTGLCQYYCDMPGYGICCNADASACECLLTDFDDDNCGTCGHACGPSQRCIGATCTDVDAGGPG